MAIMRDLMKPIYSFGRHDAPLIIQRDDTLLKLSRDRGATWASVDR